MTPTKVPYLCGGILFSLILQARKARTKARDKFNSGSDGLKDTDVMMGLIEVITGDVFSGSHGNTFGKCTTQFKTCLDYGTTYIPFTDSAVISSFNSSVKQKDPDLLKRMSEFIDRFINEVRAEWLVKALFEVIQNDAEIPQDTFFSISTQQTVLWSELEHVTEVELPIFLLSVIGFILNERKDNTKGRPTFEAWHTQSGSKSPWRYKATVGNSITGSITVKIKQDAVHATTVTTSPLTEPVKKTAAERINEKILASGQALADAWGKAMESLADELDGKKASGTTVELPKEKPSDESPYSAADTLLLKEFTADYDEIMVTLISERYGDSLIDMSLPCQIQDLYKTKWSSRADAFTDPSLKSYVFGLLGELNTLSNSFLSDNTGSPFIRSTRTKIRNLYVKLHPDLFAGAFPYDAFIDDWDEGEF